ncbi:ArnT family glycosyltransferase [Litorisediminicola beolgyonensis]|uniref:ArnT family glycosyltransferase n=1 Tax=Litorisediminicola beolgyonensis TaxID=1173614 RepID=A0ABW3ZFC7_9RHOB
MSDQNNQPKDLFNLILSLSLSITFLLSAVFIFLQIVSQTTLNHYDEFFTLDRTTGFARHHDWLTVWSQNEPSFKKPPLQYWTGAWFLEAGLPETMALRLPSFLSALLLLAATGALAFTLRPGSPWIIPAAIAFTAASPQLWSYALSAMLDIATAFWSTLAVTLALVALRRPNWWYAVAVACALGALQKAPVGVVFVGLMLWVIRLVEDGTDPALHRVTKGRTFRRAFWLMVVLVLAWPVLQVFRHGPDAIIDLYFKQMYRRFAPSVFSDPGSNAASLPDLLFVGEYALRGLGFVALLWLPVRLGRKELWGLAALPVIYVVAVIFTEGSVYSRYSLVFLPLLTAALAAMVFALPAPLWLRGGVAAALAALFSLQLEAPQLTRDPHVVQQIALAERPEAQLGSDEVLIQCKWGADDATIPGLVSVYAAQGRPFEVVGRPKDLAPFIARFEPGQTFMGFCTEGSLADVTEAVPDAAVVAQEGPFLIWRGTRPAE